MGKIGENWKQGQVAAPSFFYIAHSATRQVKVLYIKLKNAKVTHNKMTFKHTISKQVIEKQEFFVFVLT